MQRIAVGKLLTVLLLCAVFAALTVVPAWAAWVCVYASATGFDANGAQTSTSWSSYNIEGGETGHGEETGPSEEPEVRALYVLIEEDTDTGETRTDTWGSGGTN